MSVDIVESVHQSQKWSIAFASPTANGWAMSYLRHLRNQLHSAAPASPKSAESPDLVAAIAQSAQTVFNQYAQATAQRNACIAVGACALLLSSYRALAIHYASERRALQLVRSCFEQTYQAFVTHVCKPLYRNSAKSTQPPWTTLNFGHWSSNLHRDTASPLAYGYERFFEHHGAPELAPIVYATDSAWIRTASTLHHADGTSKHPHGGHSEYSGYGGFTPFQFGVRHGAERPSAEQRIYELVLD